MAYASTVPAALSALVSLFSAAPALSGVEVIDGVTLPDTSALQAVFVGYVPGDPSAESVTGAAVREGLGGAAGPDRETYTVHCAAAVINDDGDIIAARVQAYALRDAAVGAIAASRKLAPGLQLMAGPGASSLRQQQTDTGAKATVPFDVEIDAFTSR